MLGCTYVRPQKWSYAHERVSLAPEERLSVPKRFWWDQYWRSAISHVFHRVFGHRAQASINWLVAVSSNETLTITLNLERPVCLFSDTLTLQKGTFSHGSRVAWTRAQTQIFAVEKSKIQVRERNSEVTRFSWDALVYLQGSRISWNFVDSLPGSWSTVGGGNFFSRQSFPETGAANFPLHPLFSDPSYSLH